MNWQKLPALTVTHAPMCNVISLILVRTQDPCILLEKKLISSIASLFQLLLFIFCSGVRAGYYHLGVSLISLAVCISSWIIFFYPVLRTF